MNALHRKISPRKEKVVKFEHSLFPLDVQCHASGFDDDPDTVFTGYFRRLENHSCIIFQYDNNSKFRLVHLVYLGNIRVFIVETGERWEYYNFGERRVH